VPSDAEHSTAYEGHRKAYEVTVEAHPEWAAVMLFYCAVHQVERLLAFDGKHCCDHGERELELKTRYHSLWKDYRVLKSESLKTRYLEGGLFSMTPKKVREQLLGQRFTSILSDIESRITARSIIPPVKPG
jgi:hypothetical protein